MGFKVVHGLLAVGSIAFGVAAGWIGYRGLRPVIRVDPRADRRPAPGPKSRIGKPWALGSVPGLMTSVPAPAQLLPFDRTTRSYRQRWWILGGAVPQPAGDHRRQLDPQRRVAEAARAPRRDVQPAAVDGRLVHARVRVPAAHRGQPRRPLRAQRCVAARHGRVRHGLGAVGVGQLAVAPHSHARAHGRRRRVHHAVDAVADHQRVPARGARARDLLLGRDRRYRRRARTGERRAAVRALLLGLDLPREHADRRRRAGGGRVPAAEVE